MKKISIIITIVLLSTASYFLNSANGAETKTEVSNETVQQEKPKEEMKSCCAPNHKEMTAGDFTENSIYQVNSNWTDQFGNQVNIGDLRGTTQVFTMIFANCTYACPILANDMRRIKEELTKEELKNVRFTLVSIDPERDTPKRLKKFAEDQNLSLSYFQLLTGTRSDIDDLAALIGFRYKKEPDGSFSHSNIITILNKEGEIIHQQIGLNQDITKTLVVIKNQNKQGV